MKKFSLIRGKKGGKLLSVYWFAILVIVAGGIVGMVNSFYNHPYDVRELEANILSNKLVSCFESGNFNLKKNLNLVEECGLILKNFSEEPEYYVSVEFYSEIEGVNLISSFEEGNKNLISSCEIENEEYEKLAKCSRKEFYSLDNEGRGYLIKILGIIGKGEQNVR